MVRACAQERNTETQALDEIAQPSASCEVLDRPERGEVEFLNMSKGARFRVTLAGAWVLFWCFNMAYGGNHVDSEAVLSLAVGIILIFAIDVWRWVQRGA